MRHRQHYSHDPLIALAGWSMIVLFLYILATMVIWVSTPTLHLFEFIQWQWLSLFGFIDNLIHRIT